MNISRYRIFSNDNVKSKNTEKIVDKKLKKNGFVSSNENYDLGIAIGGDGSFLRMVKETSFSSSKGFSIFKAILLAGSFSP